MKLRISETREPMYPFPFLSSAQVYQKMKEYSKADREMFLVLYLNSQNKVIDCELNGIGTVKMSSVFQREVFRGALLVNACSIICIHNHPSGDCTPSSQDDELTRELVKAGRILQVQVMDHIIMGHDRYYSYGDEGKIGEYEVEADKSLNIFK